MFTGLIQETGEIAWLRQISGKTRIAVVSRNLSSQLKPGDSIAVSGVCLTAVETGRDSFCADLAEETLKRTSLGSLQKGSCVNLELPARPQDRLGGHVVQGHVDGAGQLLSLTKIKGREDWRMTIVVPADLTRYVVPQGSITVEGISLTVATIRGARIEIAVIPHTYGATNLRTLRNGSPVNIEVDVLAKYAEKQMTERQRSKITVEDLVRRGF